MTSSPSRAKTWLVLLAGLAILVLRRPDQFTNPQLWAEDGIFFFQARVIGWKAFTLELAGYHHLAPRIIAALSQAVDPRWVPHVFVACTVALTLYVMSRALSSRCPLPWRIGCALAVVLMPDAGEVLLGAANIQWFLASGFVLLLIADEPTRTSQRIHDAVAAVFLGMTGPFCILMTPLFAWRAFARRTRWSIVLASLVALCAVVQAISVLRHPLPPPVDPVLDVRAFVAYPGWRVLGGLVLGQWLPLQLAWLAGAALTAALLAAIAWLVRGGAGPRDPRLMLALAFAGLLASTWLRCWHSMPALCVPGNATRYVFAMQLVFAWLVLAGVRDPRRAVRISCIGLLGWALVINLTRLRLPPAPDQNWASYAPKLRAGEEVTIPINPAGWNFTFPEQKR